MTRRHWIGLGAFGVTAAAAYPALLEPRWLEVTETPVNLFPKTPTKPLRLLHLSDFHASIFVPHAVIDRAITLGLASGPDIACLTGDFVTSGIDFEVDPYVESLKRLSSRVPTYAIFGNHDRGRWAGEQGGLKDHQVVRQILTRSGITILHNNSERVQINGFDVNLAGMGDLWSEEIDSERAFSNVEANVPTILMSHNPDSKAVLADKPWNLMLCGHTHGGQVLVPFCGPCYAPVRDKAFVAGLKTWRGKQIFVTRGVGNLGGVRFLCRPEVSLLRLT